MIALFAPLLALAAGALLYVATRPGRCDCSHCLIKRRL